MKNFELQDQWLIDKQDKELFSTFQRCLEAIQLNKDRLIYTLYDSAYQDFYQDLEIDYQGRSTKIKFHRSSSGFFIVKLEPLFPLINPNITLDHYLIMTFYLHELGEPNKWKFVLSTDITTRIGRTVFYPMIWISPDEVRWFCLYFHWNPLTKRLDYVPNSHDLYLMDEFPNDIKVVIDQFDNNSLSLER